MTSIPTDVNKAASACYDDLLENVIVYDGWDEDTFKGCLAKAILIERYRYADLVCTASAFVEELKQFGYGETSEKALPGSADPFFEALERLK